MAMEEHSLRWGGRPGTVPPWQGHGPGDRDAAGTRRASVFKKKPAIKNNFGCEDHDGRRPLAEGPSPPSTRPGRAWRCRRGGPQDGGHHVPEPAAGNRGVVGWEGGAQSSQAFVMQRPHSQERCSVLSSSVTSERMR